MSDPRDNEVRATEGSPSAGNNVVQDCGQIISPDELKNQIEGKLIKTVSRILLGELTWDRSMVTSLDWTSYPIISFPAVPEVVIELIDRSNVKLWGAREPSAAVIPSAVSNAVFDSIGVRLRSTPFTPAKVKAATRLT
jgi:CO/xanthine dehydrogenase Mo-binding subunit